MRKWQVAVVDKPEINPGARVCNNSLLAIVQPPGPPAETAVRADKVMGFRQKNQIFKRTAIAGGFEKLHIRAAGERCDVLGGVNVVRENYDLFLTDKPLHNLQATRVIEVRGNPHSRYVKVVTAADVHSNPRI